MTEAAVSIAGNLTYQPELRHTEGGIARASFRAAVSGRRKQEASFFTVIVWRDQAEHVAESLARGDRVVVVGRLQHRSWTAEDAAPDRWWRSWPRSWGQACAGRPQRRPRQPGGSPLE
jgi:single-strand DNA-binding protein